VPVSLQSARWVLSAGREGKNPRSPHLIITNIAGVLRACQRGMGIAMLPDYILEDDDSLVTLFNEDESVSIDAFFVYPEELKSVARVQAFRDFLVSNAQRWVY
jgi:DNA-binding transcriptional LysR family regulator